MSSSSVQSTIGMLAFTISSYGEVRETLKLTTNQPGPFLDPIKSPHGVLIRVHAASLGPGDVRTASGDISLVIKKQFPYVPGLDCAGVITAVGSQVTRFSVGDAVYGNLAMAGGTLAEYVLTDEVHLAHKPKNMSFAEAATIPVSGLAAYQALHKYAQIKVGEKILILGGSGGTGSMAIQFAKAAGAQVIAATCSTRNLAFVQELGANVAIDYTTQDFSQVLKGQDYDIVCDCVGGADHYNLSKAVLKKGGRFVTLNGFHNYEQPVTLFNILITVGTALRRKFWSNFGDISYCMVMSNETAYHDLESITSLIEAGQVKASIDKNYSFTLQDCIDMFERVASHRTRGKVVMTIRDPKQSGTVAVTDS